MDVNKKMKHKASQYNYGDMVKSLWKLISLTHPVAINHHKNDIFALVRKRRAEYFDSMKGVHENMEEEHKIEMKSNIKKYLREYENMLNVEVQTFKYGVPIFGRYKVTKKDDKND